MSALIEKLAREHSLTLEEYRLLIDRRDDEAAERLAELARLEREKYYGKSVFIRGLIEISNYCKNDCYYCGIRASNKNCQRYRLTKEDILACCDEGYSLGFRTFVMQGGEDRAISVDSICNTITAIKEKYPDCAVTLSLGEYDRTAYEKFRKAGADRYLLRHETADAEHYGKLHPEKMKLEARMDCLKTLKGLGFQVGCGFMVGSPYQTSSTIAKDLKFIEEFSPDMCGIGPFIPHKDTPFNDRERGTVSLTTYLLSIVRLIKPNILLPSTTALGSIDETGREKGILAGANVVMPNLTPFTERKKYTLYNDKLIGGAESAQSLNDLKERMKKIGYEIVSARGDIKNNDERKH